MTLNKAIPLILFMFTLFFSPWAAAVIWISHLVHESYQNYITQKQTKFTDGQVDKLQALEAELKELTKLANFKNLIK